MPWRLRGGADDTAAARTACGGACSKTTHTRTAAVARVARRHKARMAAVADNIVVQSELKVLPVPPGRQVKPSSACLSAPCLPPLCVHVCLVSTSAEGASGFCQTMPPSDRQLMSIGASEHRTSVRAKARFAGQRLRNTVLSVEMLLHRTYCYVSLVAFSGGKCRACLALPEVPASDLPVLIHSRWTASCQALCRTRLCQV